MNRLVYSDLPDEIVELDFNRILAFVVPPLLKDNRHRQIVDPPFKEWMRPPVPFIWLPRVKHIFLAERQSAATGCLRAHSDFKVDG